MMKKVLKMWLRLREYPELYQWAQYKSHEALKWKRKVSK